MKLEDKQAKSSKSGNYSNETIDTIRDQYDRKIREINLNADMAKIKELCIELYFSLQNVVNFFATKKIKRFLIFNSFKKIYKKKLKFTLVILSDMKNVLYNHFKSTRCANRNELDFRIDLLFKFVNEFAKETVKLYNNLIDISHEVNRNIMDFQVAEFCRLGCIIREMFSLN